MKRMNMADWQIGWRIWPRAKYLLLSVWEQLYIKQMGEERVMRKREHLKAAESLRSSVMEAEETSEFLPLPFQKSSMKERNLTAEGEDGEDGGLGVVSAEREDLLWSMTMTRCSFPGAEEVPMVRLEATPASICSMVGRDSVDSAGEEVQEVRGEEGFIEKLLPGLYVL